MEFLNFCPVCHHNNLKDFIESKDFTVSQEKFSIQQCENCGLLFTNPRPSQDDIGKYYQSEEYISHSDSKKGFVNSLYHRIRKFAISGKIKFINQLHSSAHKNLLDIGAGTGEFLHAAVENGWSVAGVEPGELARENARTKFGFSFLKQIEDLEVRQQFNVITLWHVLEHIHELENSVKKIHDLLSPQGKVIIAVPNVESLDRKFYKNYWAAWDVPRHLYHFNERSIKILFENLGFKLILKKGMPFDSFYVSMLSEKYNGSNNYIRAGIVGLISNIAGFFKEKNFSSKIYVFEKI